MAQTFAQLVAPAANSLDADPTGVLLQAARLAKKASIYANLNSVGITGTTSWTTGSVPSSMAEMYAWALNDYDIAQAFVAQGGLNSTATGDALTTLAFEFYDNARAAGATTVAQLLLSDVASAGPFTFAPASVAFSVGKGGLLFNGVDLGGGSVTVPKGGTAYVNVQAAAAGSKYSALSLNTVNFFARGALPGVTVTNDANWLTGTGAVVGTDSQSDASLQAQNSAQWGTLGIGSPASAYQSRAIAAAPTQVTRVAVLSNLDILDPGRVDVIIAGSAGALGAGVVTTVQNAFTPTQTGGAFIPETARCVVTSAANLGIVVAATVFVQASYNTAAFQAQIGTDFAAYAAAFPIGGAPLAVVPFSRLIEILQFRAGLAPGIIYNETNFSPSTDTALTYLQVPVFTMNLTFVSV